MPSPHTAIFVLAVASSLVVALSDGELPVKFSYENGSSTGPAKWGSLSPQYKLCSDGKQQSPINIVKANAVFNGGLKHLDRSYAAANATLINTGYQIKLKFNTKVGPVLVDGKNYSLEKLHWHTPSEHTIDGERYPMELHLVHKSDDGGYAVVAILYRYGRPESFFFQLKNRLDELAKDKCGEEEEAHVAVGTVHMRALMKRTRKYFRYTGSLTHPPCTQNVSWHILGRVREMTKEQETLLTSPLAAKSRICARPTQPLNGRTVQLYDESKY